MASKPSITGLREAQRALRRLGRRAAPAAARQGLRAAAGVLQDEVLARVPRRTGELADSVAIREAGPLALEVVAVSDHAAAVEFGTSEMAAEPFFRPALDNAGDRARAAAAARIRASLGLGR